MKTCAPSTDAVVPIRRVAGNCGGAKLPWADKVVGAAGGGGENGIGGVAVGAPGAADWFSGLIGTGGAAEVASNAAWAKARGAASARMLDRAGLLAGISILGAGRTPGTGASEAGPLETGGTVTEPAAPPTAPGTGGSSAPPDRPPNPEPPAVWLPLKTPPALAASFPSGAPSPVAVPAVGGASAIGTILRRRIIA